MENEKPVANLLEAVHYIMSASVSNYSMTAMFSIRDNTWTVVFVVI